MTGRAATVVNQPRNRLGRLTAYGQLEPMQRRYTRHILAGHDSDEAARLSGYANPESAAAALENNQAVKDAIAGELERMCGVISGAVLTKLAKLVKGETLDNDARALLAIWRATGDKVLSDAKPREQGSPDDGRSIDDMQAEVDELRRMRSNEAHPVMDADVIPADDEPHIGADASID